MAALVYERTGIYLPDTKVSLLSNRLRKRLRVLGLDEYEAYYNLLRDPKQCEEELPHFLSAVTTNETYFFRNDALWTYIRGTWIPAIVAQMKATGKRSIRVWSAAGSSGEEAYTTAICLFETIPDIANWKVEVVGSDISERVLDKAKIGDYNDYAVSKMSAEEIAKWFDVEQGVHRVKPKLKSIVNFRFHNLRDKFPYGPFDLAFLRNVLMYFDLDMKRRVLTNVVDALVPGGHLVVGDVDPLRNVPAITQGIEIEFRTTNVYQKPERQRVAAASGGVRS